MGQGSTFLVYLPLAVAERPTEPVAPVLRSAGGTETILLVEDEPSVRLVATAMLRQLGYRVLVAADGPAALRLWAKHAREIHLLVTDMVMPEGLTGLELAARLRAAQRTLKVIVISGYTDEILKAEQLNAAGATLLPKPFEFEAFAATVCTALG